MRGEKKRVYCVFVKCKAWRRCFRLRLCNLYRRYVDDSEMHHRMANSLNKISVTARLLSSSVMLLSYYSSYSSFAGVPTFHCPDTNNHQPAQQNNNYTPHCDPISPASHFHLPDNPAVNLPSVSQLPTFPISPHNTAESPP